jgi:hypothetical protein
MGVVPIDYSIKITGEGRKDCFSHLIVFLKFSFWFTHSKGNAEFTIMGKLFLSML